MQIRYKETNLSSSKIFNFLNDDSQNLYFPSWLEENKFNNPIEQVPRILGALNSPSIKDRYDIIYKNLEKLDSFIHKNNLSKFLIQDDISNLISFSQDPKYSPKIKLIADQILSAIFLYDDEVSHQLYERGVFDEMIQNYFKPCWLNGLARFCSKSFENREKIFQLGIPLEIKNRLENEFKNQYISIYLLEVAYFTHSLCLFPLTNQDEFVLLDAIFTMLVSVINKVQIHVENNILSALIPYVKLNDQCFNSFAKFNIFDLYVGRSDSYNSENLLKIARLFSVANNYSLEYAKDIAISHHGWDLIISFYEKYCQIEKENVDGSLNIYFNPTKVISYAAFPMAEAASEFFIENNVYLFFIQIYPNLNFFFQKQINNLFYILLIHSDDSHISMILNGNNKNYFLEILFSIFPDLNDHMFIKISQGLNRILNFLTALGDGGKEIINTYLLQSDQFQDWIHNSFENADSLNDISEEVKNQAALIISSIFHNQNIEE